MLFGRFTGTIQSILLNGILPEELEEPPAMLSVACRDHKPFISIFSDFNPIDGSCDANIDVNVEAITIVFDAVSVG